MVVAGQVLGGRFQCRAKMGTGGFADIFLGVDLVTGNEVAIKAMSQKQTAGAGLKWESEVLARIDGAFAPKLIHYSAGDLTELPYIVMELLRGEDVSEIRHRQSSPRLPLSVCVHLAKEVVSLLEKLHSLGIIHRDIKPNNFMRKHRKERKLFLIDFGIAKKIVDDDGKIKPERKSADFRGTTMYASVHAHLKKDLSKRDDLISAFYVFMDLLLGRVPWADEAKAKAKDAVLDYKEKYMKHPDRIVRDDPVLSSRPDAAKLINALARITKYLNGLAYEDEPDYRKLQRLYDDVKELATEGEGSFEWEGPKTGGIGGYGRAKADESHMDPQTRTAYFRQQISSLGMGLLPEADLARVWSRVARRLYSTESQQLVEGSKRQLLSSLMDVADRHGSFFLVDGMTDDEFAELQVEAVHRVEKAVGRVKRQKTGN